jgi:GlcNAc-P-P-Und epimerase
MEPRPESPYGASKLAGEKVLEEWVRQAPERKLLIVRPTVVFGPGNMANMKSLIRQIDSGFYFHLGKGDNVKSIAYVENVVAATLYLRSRMKAGLAVYNYADEPQLTSRQIGDHIARYLKRRIRITVPKQLAVLMGLPFDLAIKLTGKNLPISSARIEKLGTETYFSADKIFKEGFKPRFTSIEGLGKMVAWYQQEKRAAN